MEFRNIDNKGTVEGYCLVKTADKKVNVKGVPYLDLVLADRTGEMNAKLWDFKEDVHGWIAPGMLIKVRGVISEYNGADQMKIERTRPVTEIDNIRVEDFVPSAPYNGNDMLSAITDFINTFNNEELKRLVLAVLQDKKEQILYCPAAFKLHHAVRSGLLYHTLSILQLAKSVCEIYPFLDKDLLFAGVILHDVAKIDEFDVDDTGIVTSYTVDGTLIGHLVRGAMIVEKKADELGISKETAMLLEHMLISHHGEPEFGAAVRPMTLEAVVLSELDTLDAKVNEIQTALSLASKGDFTQRQWALDNRKFYKHSENDTNDAKLF